MNTGYSLAKVEKSSSMCAKTPNIVNGLEKIRTKLTLVGKLNYGVVQSVVRIDLNSTGDT